MRSGLLTGSGSGGIPPGDGGVIVLVGTPDHGGGPIGVLGNFDPHVSHNSTSSGETARLIDRINEVAGDAGYAALSRSFGTVLPPFTSN